MAAIPVSELNYTTGAVPASTALAALSNTASIGNGVNTFLKLTNTNASPRTVTIDVQGTTDYGQALPDPEYTLAALTGELYIPLSKDYDSGAANTPGSAIFTVDAFEDVNATVIRLG